MKIRYPLLLAASLAFPLLSTGASLSSVEEREALRVADANYRSALERCDELAADARDACKAEAEAARKAVKSSASKSHRQAEKKREARSGEARDELKAAKAQCAGLEGDAKKVCVETAKATTEEKVARAYDQAGNERLETNRRVDLVGCANLTGREKDACVQETRARYGK